MIQAIEKLNPVGSLLKEEKTGSTNGANPFESIFRSAVEQVKQTDAEKNQAEYLLATGQLDNPAELMTALTKNELSVSLLVQLRNKALDAYSELARISI